MNDLDIRPLTPTIGSEIHGVDLSKPLEAPLREQIQRALLDHQVVFFPNQRLSPDEHMAFGRCFGELQTKHAPYLRVLDDAHPEVVVIDNDAEQPGRGIDRADVWHTDVTFQERPPTGSILYMQTLPDTGGDTLWVNLTAAYEALSEPMRRLLDPLQAAHDLAYTALRQSDRYAAPREAIAMLATGLPVVEHPVVRTHPHTGRRGLFVNRTFTSHIVGLPRDESDAILDFLYQHCIKPEFSVRRRWKQADVGFWDNRCTMHYAVNDYGANPRCIHRVTLLGERPC